MPESLRPFNPKMSHLLLNEREMPPESLKDDSIAAQLVRLEQAQSEQELNAAIGAVLELLPDAADPRQAALLAAFSLFYASAKPEAKPEALPKAKPESASPPYAPCCKWDGLLLKTSRKSRA